MGRPPALGRPDGPAAGFIEGDDGLALVAISLRTGAVEIQLFLLQ